MECERIMKYILQVPVFEVLPPAFEVKKSSSPEYVAAS
jgi:hypothetical protein